ncbi:MAG: 3-phosphoshikimate 1-carboxyvinyltransferase [Burkholderiales bacterium]
MKALDLGPLSRAAGTVRLPGSKSISNRVLLLAALARGETEVRGLLDAEDTQVMRAALGKLGARLSAKRAELFLGNAGTALRPLTAVLALAGGEYRLSGSPRMHERPIRDLVDALRALGARIDYLGAEGFPPLAIHPGRIAAGQTVSVRGDVSSQYLSALLVALPLAGGGTIEVEGDLISKPYVEITLNLMQRFGVEVRRSAWRRFVVPGTAYVSPGKVLVEGDASSASYFLAAGAIAGAISGLAGGGPVRVEGVGRASIQGDVRFTEVLEAMGARVALGEGWIEAEGHAPLRAFDLDLNHIPDAAMTAAAMALFADGPCVVRNIASWRVKETDRIAAMATELGKLGAGVEAGADYLKVVPRALASGVALDTYDDHRMAMSLSLAALGGVRVRIKNPDCVAKTFPGYFAAFARIAR